MYAITYTLKGVVWEQSIGNTFGEMEVLDTSIPIFAYIKCWLDEFTNY